MLLLKIISNFVQTTFRNRPHNQLMLTNISWLSLDYIIRIGVGFFVSVWVTKYLGAEQYGKFSYASAIVTIFTAFATCGLDSILIRNLINNPMDADRLLGTAYVLKILAGLLASVMATLSILILRPTDTAQHWLVGIMAIGIVFQSTDVISFWFQSKVLSKFTVIVKNTSFLLMSGVKIILILTQSTLFYFALCVTIEFFIVSIGFIIIYHIDGNSMKTWHFSLQESFKLLQDSWPLIFSGIIIVIYMRIDQIMLGEMISDKEVGIYTTAIRIAEVLYFIPMVTVPTFFPSIINAKKEGDVFFYKKLQQLYNLMAFLGYAVAIPITFLGPYIIEFLFGHEYSRAGPMLAVFIWAGIFTNLGVARSTFLTAMNFNKFHLVAISSGGIVNIALNCVLIPRYGGMGAVIASCVAYWLAAHGSCFFYKPLYKTGGMLTKAMLYPKFW